MPQETFFLKQAFLFLVWLETISLMGVGKILAKWALSALTEEGS